ncbi:uracil-DNA glycosylase [Paracoccus sp. DMF-8]|uniref:uracil-DNA glycosylase n=1 Tax=Paracoccus sp. DMF-8 TaxID=3019445 RepID=UPI0023E7E7A9|nr:uracil-DNA glycosylase [Paracoccus sp. DMF-8]MDF3607023.1 uracil-DNA glycosylase [Paracoccus sp. DMF-8]
MSDLSYRGSALDAETALALLQWQAELGADEPCLDEPIDRYDEARAAEAERSAARAPIATAAPQSAPRPPTPAAAAADALAEQVTIATRLAAAATTLEELAEAQRGFDGIELRKGARNFCFADGNPKARVMVIGEAPGEEEDLRGLPFVGRAGQLLDRMFAAIHLARDAVDAERALYIANVLTWRPPGNRRPEPGEVAVMLPFLARHVDLVDPEVIVLMGNTPCQAALDPQVIRQGILRLRGNWTTAFGRPALPMTHPSYLLRTPAAKREAWADLLSLSARIDP